MIKMKLPFSKKKMLIFSDEKFIREYVKAATQDIKDLTIFLSSDLKESMDVTRKNYIDIILYDISFDKKNNLQFLQFLKENNLLQNKPIIAIGNDREDILEALEEGIANYIIKPLDIIELKFKLLNLLRSKSYYDLKSILNTQLEGEIKKREEELKQYLSLQKELSIAKKIQESLFPKEYPSTDKLDVYGKCIMCFDVGGDYFNVFKNDQGKYNLIIADATGHGIAAAIFIAQFSLLVKIQLMTNHASLSQKITNLNNIFYLDHSDSGMFITAIMCQYSPETDEIIYVNAGHPKPISSLQKEFKISYPPLNILNNIEYKEDRYKIEKGETLLFYTDGIVEAANMEGEMYGIDRLKDTFFKNKHLSSKEIVEAIIKDIKDFTQKFDDDLTLLALKKL